MLVKVKKTKFKVVHLPCAVEVDLVKKQTVVCKRNLETHFVETLHEFSKVEASAEVFVHTSEALSEPFKFFNYFKVGMLNKLVRS